MPSDKKKLKCVECGKFFSTRFNLKMHFEVIHPEIPAAEKTYFCAAALWMNAPKKNGNFKCKICSKNLARKENLVAHLKTHSDTRNHIQCDMCAKVFTIKSNLTRHKRKQHSNTIVDLQSTKSVKKLQKIQQIDADPDCLLSG